MRDCFALAVNRRKLANFFRQHDPRLLSQVERIFEDFGGDVKLQAALRPAVDFLFLV